MRFGTKWFIQDHHLTSVSCVLALTTTLAVVLYLTGADWKALLGVIGGLLSVVFLVQRQQIEEAKLIKELFSDFNKRYDGMNEKLNKITNTPSVQQQLSTEETNTLCDYFNLCGEEYLYYRRGYVYPEVWRSWQAGMNWHFEDNRVRERWIEDSKDGSYYG